MINRTGIYVFESKNYSGWIFGDEKNKNWTQSLKGGKKYKFLNPVLQNKGHINALRKIIGEFDNKSIFSYIVFSERCELKKVSIASLDVIIVKRNQLLSLLLKNMEMKPEVLTELRVEELYETLQKYCLANEIMKQNHIRRIKVK